MTITHIWSRTPIDCSADIPQIMGAAMGGVPATDAMGEKLKFLDLPNGTLGTPAHIWNASYSDRKFKNLESRLAVMLDILGEYAHGCATDALRYEWLRSPDRASDSDADDGFGPPGIISQIFVSDGDGSATECSGIDLDLAIDTAMVRSLLEGGAL